MESVVAAAAASTTESAVDGGYGVAGCGGCYGADVDGDGDAAAEDAVDGNVSDSGESASGAGVGGEETVDVVAGVAGPDAEALDGPGAEAVNGPDEEAVDVVAVVDGPAEEALGELGEEAVA